LTFQPELSTLLLLVFDPGVIIIIVIIIQGGPVHFTYFNTLNIFETVQDKTKWVYQNVTSC